MDAGTFVGNVPEGVEAISRWLSAATPPEIVDYYKRTPKGVPASAFGWHALRGAIG